MFFLVIIVLILMLLFFPYFRYFVMHPFTCWKGAILDIYHFIKYKRANECKEYGKVFLFTASGSKAFGSGKTLSMVRYVKWLYNRYNGLLVWDEESNEFVTQRIIVISNVEFKDIPYIPFIGRDQFVDIDKIPHTEHDILVFCIDEAGMEFNSRNYKDNLPTDFLVRLLQVRHNKCAFVMTAQRFTFVDKVLRQICGVVTTCQMKWRIVRLQDYDAFALENLNNPAMLAPISTRYYFANDKLFKSYDTTYNVEKLKTQLEEGDILNTEEILSRIGDNSNPVAATNKLRKQFRGKNR